MSKDRKIFQPEVLPNNERPLGRFQADTHGKKFHPLASLAEAQGVEDGVVILQGDDGGQIYLVCPASLIKCAEAALEQLLVDLDEIAWPGNYPNMRRIYYERLVLGSPVAGGMGGGQVTKEAWIHSAFAKAGLGPAIQGVLGGMRERIR